MNTRLRVLLVEDTPTVADLVREHLSQALQAEFDVECVACLASAVSILERNQVDVVLLDLGLPDSTGLETLASVLKAAPRKPIIVLTGMDDQDLGLDSLKMGAQEYLPKGGLSPELLIRTVLRSVERKRLQDELRTSEERLQEAGIDALMNKPFLMNDIAATIRKLLDQADWKGCNRWQSSWSLMTMIRCED